MVEERPSRIERRLSAILAADVTGYSRLMHDEEEPTHARLTAHLADAVAPAIAEHGGRIGARLVISTWPQFAGHARVLDMVKARSPACWRFGQDATGLGTRAQTAVKAG
jgi:class 3 adenylate cyclase